MIFRTNLTKSYLLMRDLPHGYKTIFSIKTDYKGARPALEIKSTEEIDKILNNKEFSGGRRIARWNYNSAFNRRAVHLMAGTADYVLYVAGSTRQLSETFGNSWTAMRGFFSKQPYIVTIRGRPYVQPQPEVKSVPYTPQKEMPDGNWTHERGNVFIWEPKIHED